MDFLKKFIFKEKSPLLTELSKDDPKLYTCFKYLYANQKVPYCSEEIYINPSELKKIKSLLENINKNSQITDVPFLPKALINKKPKKIIIDTDIGTDWDDVLALLMTLHLDQRDVELLGITTNYHPTLLRKKVAETILSRAGPPFNKVKVIAGPTGLCGTHRDYFHHGNEGQGLELSSEEAGKLWETNESLEAIDFIYNNCKENPLQITIVSIGIPTNLGLCCYLHKDFGDLVGHIVVMGGGSLLKNNSKNSENRKKTYFELPDSSSQVFSFKNQPKIPGFHLFPNHNLSGDTLASKMLFDSKCPISIIPHDVTSKHWLEGISVETLLHHGMTPNSPLNNEIPISGKLAYEWLSRRWGQRGQCVHDPLTVYEAVYPEDEGDLNFVKGKSSLVYMRGTLIVHEWAAFSSFVTDKVGRHRIAIEAKSPERFMQMLEEILLQNIDPKDMVEKWAGKY